MFMQWPQEQDLKISKKLIDVVDTDVRDTKNLFTWRSPVRKY